jgi:hypothetical protein
VPQLTFAYPADTVLTRYVNVPVAAWLGGARWAVVSGEYNEAAVIDFRTKSARALGGKGDAELRNPYAVFASRDTIWVTDWALRRATLWTSDGKLVGSLPAVARLEGALPVARDAAGQLYFEIKPIVMPNGRGTRDSAVVVRAAATFARFDTVARMSPLDLAEMEDTQGKRFERRVFSGQDRWGVLPDGTIWVARVYQNFVMLIPPSGKPVRGEDLPDRVIEVSNPDRDQFVQQFPEELRSTAERLPFSPIKPPFEQALATPDGIVWLEKSRPAVDSVRTYQVLDRQGHLAYLAVLPSRQGHLIALGDSTGLMAEQYRQGVRLMQVKLPKPPR